jgi:hypothetical protein
MPSDCKFFRPKPESLNTKHVDTEYAERKMRNTQVIATHFSELFTTGGILPSSPYLGFYAMQVGPRWRGRAPKHLNGISSPSYHCQHDVATLTSHGGPNRHIVPLKSIKPTLWCAEQVMGHDMRGHRDMESTPAREAATMELVYLYRLVDGKSSTSYGYTFAQHIHTHTECIHTHYVRCTCNTCEVHTKMHEVHTLFQVPVRAAGGAAV